MINKFTKEVFEAAMWTFIQTFLATLAPAMIGLNMTDWGALSGLAASAAISGLAASLSLVKSLVVRNLGAQDSIFISGGE